MTEIVKKYFELRASGYYRFTPAQCWYMACRYANTRSATRTPA